MGATRGREDNTIHIVADDFEDAKAQFMTTLTRPGRSRIDCSCRPGQLSCRSIPWQSIRVSAALAT